MYQPLGNLIAKQRLGFWEGMGNSNLGMGPGRKMERRVQKQENKLERMQQRLSTMQQDPNKAKQIAQLQSRIAQRTTHLESMKQQWAAKRGGPLTIPGLAPTGVTAPAPVSPALVGPPGWNEAAYLSKYPDVAKAVKTGAIPSGLWHYNAHGQKEGRSLSGWTDIAANNKIIVAVLAVVALCWWKTR